MIEQYVGYVGHCEANAQGIVKESHIEALKAEPNSCEYWDSESHFCALRRPQAEPTYEQVKDSCNKHGLVLVDKDLWNSMVLELQTRKVVLCKDCKHHEDEELGMVYCPNIVGGWVSNNFHCGDAERKDEQTEYHIENDGTYRGGE